MNFDLPHSDDGHNPFITHGQLDMETIAAQLLFQVDKLTEAPVESNERFFSQLLDILNQGVGATKGTIWQRAENQLTIWVQAVSDLEKRSGLDSEEERFVRESFMENPTGNFIYTDPHREVESQLNRCCLIIPLFDHSQCIGLVSLIVYVGETADAIARLELLKMVSERIRKSYLMIHYAQSDAEWNRLQKANRLTTSIGKHIRLKPSIHESVNQLRHYLKADRVTLTFKYGNKCVVKGISNQAIFNKRSNVIRRLETLAARIAKLEETMWFPDDSTEYAPALQGLVDKYFEASNVASVCMIPLFAEEKRRDDPENIAATIQSDEQRKTCFGVLVVERMDEPLEKDRILRRWNRVKEPVSNSINNAKTHESLFLMPVWRTLGKFTDFYRGHTQRKAWLITALIAVLIGALIVIPGDFKLRGDGVIQPVERQHLFAETDGVVQNINFVDGQFVKEDELLLQMSNPELASRIVEVEGKLREEKQQLQTVTMQRVSREFENDEDLRELVRQTTASEARIAGLEKQLTILQKNADQLLVRSPMSGQVITWDSKQRLVDRPVSRGDRLLTIAQQDSIWEVVLRVPDKRAGYMLDQWNTNPDMKASFVLASNPREVFEGKISEISPNSNVDDKDDENVVRVRILLTAEEFAKIKLAKPGTTIIGHVYCGRASIGYCKLYEFFDWTQRMWFRFIS